MKFFGRDKNKEKKNYILLVVLLAVLLATLLRAGVMCTSTNSYIIINSFPRIKIQTEYYLMLL